jgi:hypothetical protein
VRPRNLMITKVVVAAHLAQELWLMMALKHSNKHKAWP